MARRRRAQRVVSSDDDSEPSLKSEPSATSSDEEAEGEGRDLLVELEAAGEDDEDAQSSSDEDNYGPDSTFHPFSQLPPELRNKVWDLFCPDLTASTRVLRLGLELDDDEADNQPTGHFWEGSHLEAMTEAFRCLSSVHRESRQRALKFAPDEIILGGHSNDAVVRVNGAKDILCLDYIHYSPRIEHSSQWQPACGGPAQNIAIGCKDYLAMSNNGGIMPFTMLFPKLKVVYNMTEEISLNDRWLRWCATDYAQKYYHERLETLEPIPQVMPMLLCFPNTERYPDFTKSSLGGLARNHCDESLVKELEELGLVLRPMISFPYMAGLERFEELEKAKNVPLPQLPPDWPSDAEEEALAAVGAEEDDDDSDGINDEDISEADLSSEDELIPRPISPGSDAETPISIHDPSGDEGPAATLSSMEPSEDEGYAAKRKRRVVSDSDDDEEETRHTSAQRPSGPSQTKRRRVVQRLGYDSETETGNDNPAIDTAARSEPEDDSTESSSSEEENVGPRPMSLTQRLRQQPACRQVTENKSDSDEDEEEDNGSAADEEDEEDDELLDCK
ncbi:hypothetical protein ACHAP8_010093 [Fusarium lateritium]